MTHSTPNEREDWQKIFLDAGTKYTGIDLSIMTPTVSALLSRTRQEEREKVVKYIREKSKDTSVSFEEEPLYEVPASLLEQARNLT